MPPPMRWLSHTALTVAMGLLVGCAPAAEPTATPQPATGPATSPAPASPTLPASPAVPATASPRSPTAEPTIAGPATTAPGTDAPTTPSGPTYTNPVYAQDFPDPHVLLVDDVYYAYSTNVSTSNMPVIRSTDLVNWERLGDGLPALPPWAEARSGLTWAPGVIQIGDTFVLYFVSRDDASNLQCLGVAVADDPAGPFRDDSDEPFICQVELGGSIDAYPWRDEDGQLYLYWKNDGNCCGKPVGLWVQPLSGDGLTLLGEPVELIQRDQVWELPLIENPAMYRHQDDYYLFYSGNWWESHRYAVGYALCESATGPCEKPRDEPIFEFTPEVMGPGGQAVFTDREGNTWLAYHAWTGPTVGYPEGARSLRIDPLSFEDGEPVITGPTSDPQPLP